LKYNGKLPDYYISKNYAYSKGWENKRGNLQTVLPNHLIGGDLFYNTEGKLPQSKIECGMKQILIMNLDIETKNEYYIQMTV